MGWTWIKKCPVFFLLTVSGLAFSLVGLAGRFSMYKGYEFQALKEPFLVLMLEGAGKGVAPWEVCFGQRASGKGGKETAATVGGGGQNIEDFIEDDSGAANDGMEMDTGGESADGTDASADAGAKGAEGTEDAAKTDVSAGLDAPADTGTENETIYEFQQVPEDYFNDAAFIGDSRTVGLYEYGEMEMRADFFAKISLTIYDVFTEPVAKDEETGKRITVEEALGRKQYGKVYLMLGLNELGTGTTESFTEEYAAVVDKLRELQPDAVIFVQGIMRVTEAKNESDPVFNNANINEKNDAISRLADNKDIFYIDVNEAVCDENGNLHSEYTTDDVHLKAKYYGIWREFLLNHGIVRNGAKEG